MVKSEDKRFIVFHNEYNEQTYINRNKNETINDRNDRAIRKVAQWYQTHLPSKIKTFSFVMIKIIEIKPLKKVLMQDH